MNELNIYELHFLGPIEPNLTIDIVLFFICLSGMILNITLFYITLSRKRPKPIDIVLILIISFFDSLVCFTLIISLILRWYRGSDVLIETSFWCKFNAMFLNPSLLSTLLGAASLALVRYLALVRKWELSNKIWIVVSLFLVCLVWVTFTYRSITNQLMVFPSGLYCVPKIYGKDWETSLFGYMLELILNIASMTIIICYTLIIIHFHLQASRKYTSFLYRGTLHLILTVLAYVLCIFPDTIHLILSQLFQIPRTALSDGIVMTLSFTATIINALFALFLHDEINEDFRSVIQFFESRSDSFEIS